jgi:hypothetical protein
MRRPGWTPSIVPIGHGRAARIMTVMTIDEPRSYRLAVPSSIGAWSICRNIRHCPVFRQPAPRWRGSDQRYLKTHSIAWQKLLSTALPKLGRNQESAVRRVLAYWMARSFRCGG